MLQQHRAAIFTVEWENIIPKNIIRHIASIFLKSYSLWEYFNNITITNILSESAFNVSTYLIDDLQFWLFVFYSLLLWSEHCNTPDKM